MLEKVAYEKWSGRRLYNWLRFDLNFRTKSNHHLSLANIYKVLQNPFYYDVFEYLVGSGNFYTGKHEPIIAQELFEKVREQLKRSAIQRERKEFAFTKLIKCELCASGITADEKFKKQQNGNIHRYVYYGCTKSKDLNCKNGYIREAAPLEQIFRLIDTIDLDKTGLRKRFEQEVERYHNFRRGVLGIKERNEGAAEET